jgi:hypothetical protein
VNVPASTFSVEGTQQRTMWIRRVKAVSYQRSEVKNSLSHNSHDTRRDIQYWPKGPPKVTHGPAHSLRARSARHLQYMNGWHTRNKRVMKRV